MQIVDFGGGVKGTIREAAEGGLDRLVPQYLVDTKETKKRAKSRGKTGEGEPVMVNVFFKSSR